jgi:general secretion pathway protein F
MNAPLRLDGYKPASARKAARLSPARRAVLMRQMATLAAVMPISDAVATLARQETRPAEKAVLGNINRSLQAGSSLASSLPAAAFPPHVRGTVAAGEQSGRLGLLLGRLADTLEAQVALRSRLMAALAYPVLLLLVAVGVIVAMLVFVVPGIAEQLTASGAELPWLTRAVLAASDFLRAWGLWLLLFFALALLGLLLALRRPGARARFDAALLRTPGLGPWLASIEGVRWSRLLGTMVGAGLPLAEALELTAPTLGNAAWREGTEKMAVRVRSGASLSAGLPLLPGAPPLLLSLTRSGEASGRLAPLLEGAATTLDQQVADRSRAVLSLAEPVIIVLMGGIVGLIIVAVLLPILQLNQLAAGGPIP